MTTAIPVKDKYKLIRSFFHDKRKERAKATCQDCGKTSIIVIEPGRAKWVFTHKCGKVWKITLKDFGATFLVRIEEVSKTWLLGKAHE